MVLEMKVPSPGESITEVEIATWLVEDGDYVEEGDAVEVGAVVCHIDTSAAKPEGTAPAKEEKPAETPKKEEKKVETKTTYASGTASPAAKKVLAEKGMTASQVKGTGRDGRITCSQYSIYVKILKKTSSQNMV